MSKKSSIRRSATLEINGDSEEDSASFQRGMSNRRILTASITYSKKSLSKSNSTILTDSTGKTLTPRSSLTKADQLILASTSGLKSLPPRKSTSIYSKHPISKTASTSSTSSLKRKKPAAASKAKKSAKAVSILNSQYKCVHLLGFFFALNKKERNLSQ